jgi:serine-type D-Ala-D-Ala carboxypeptidase/endopeptidase (penicillin-binding protein 4)
VTVDHVLDPAAHAAEELIRLLEERGVTVVGEGRSGDIDRPFVGRLATVRSPPMEDLLRFAVQRSDNQLTDGLFQAIGRIRTGEGSWTRGERALRQVLDRLEIDHASAVFADGSGLSRDDRLTARLLVDLDRQMTSGPHAETWLSLMAVMGESGTLRERLRGTVAAGRFHGKTGTLRDVTALSGSVIGNDGARYHLAVIANDATGPGRWAARELMDELILQLSADTAGCSISSGDVDPEQPRVPRSVISC